jgi:hypothetical protein
MAKVEQIPVPDERLLTALCPEAAAPRRWESKPS